MKNKEELRMCVEMQKKIVYGTLEEFTETVKELINKYI